MSDVTTQAALHVAYGDALPEQIDAQVVQTLRRNRVPVALLPGVADRSEFQNDVDRLREFRNEFLRVAEAWTAAAIDHVLIKSAGSDPYTSDNVDVLVDPDDQRCAVELLHRAGYREVNYLREPYKLFFRKVFGANLGFAVHLHTGVAWITTFLDGRMVLKSARAMSDEAALKFPSPEHAFLITTAHWLYEDKELKIRDLVNSYRCLQEGVDLDNARRLARRNGWETGFDIGCFVLHCASQALQLPSAGAIRVADGVPRWVHRSMDEWASNHRTLPLKLPRLQAKGLHFEQIVAKPGLSFPERARQALLIAEFAVRVKTGIGVRPRGIAVGCSGPDGAGKTTLSKRLVEELRARSLPSEYHWSRLGSSGLLDGVKKVSRARGPRSPARSTSLLSDPHGHKAYLATHPRLQVAWAMVLGADYVVRLWARTVAKKREGGVQVFDRHLVDAAVDLRLGYNQQEVSRVLKLGPRPHLSLVLTAAVDDLRRGDTPATREYLKESLQIYRAYAADTTEALVLDATAEIDDNVEIVLARIIELLLPQEPAPWWTT